MQKALYGLSVILGLALGFGIGVLNATAQDISMDEIKSLSGYKSYGTLSSFKKHLQKDPELYRAFKSNPTLSEKILGSTNLQRQMLRDINASVNVQRVVSKYAGPVSAASTNSDAGFWADKRMRNAKPPQMGAVTPAEEDDADKNESQRLGGSASGDANLRAQQAIEQAQREREAAQKRADEMLAKLDEQKKLADEARILRELAEAEAMMASIKEAFEGHPEAEADFFAHTELLQKVIDKEMTLDDALADAGITLDAPAPKDDDIIFDDEFEDNLKHVVGAYYDLGGQMIADLNHVPDDSLMAPDANGWPKYLNVPADCPAPDARVNYFHEFRTGIGYGRGHVSGFQKLNSGSMDLVKSYFGSPGITFHIGLTTEEALAVPFYTDNVHRLSNFQTTANQSVDSMDMRQAQLSISKCPGSFEEEHVETTYCLMDNSNLKKSMANKPIELLGDAQEPKHRSSCVLKPNHRYYFNYRPQAQADTPKGDKLVDHIAEYVNSMSQATVPGVQGFMDAASNALKRNGMFVGTKQHGTGGSSYAGSMNKYNLYPPYAGPCLNSGPYPINYNESMCDRSRAVPDSHKDSPSLIYAKKRQWKCYDPTDKLPPVTFTREVVGNNLVWTEGYGETSYSNYACEFYTDGSNKIEKPQFNVCAAHRENQQRKVHIGTGYSNVITRQWEQCQFDKEIGRFDWVTVDNKTINGAPPNKYRNSRKTFHPESASYQRKPHSNKCEWEGKEYALGTVMTQTVTSGSGASDSAGYGRYGTNEYVCEQRADAPALPRFAHVDTGQSPLPEVMIGSCSSCGTYKVSFK